METVLRRRVSEVADWSDDQVIERVLAGDTGLYELLVRRYNQRVYRAVRAVLRDDAEAEDVMQEAYVRAYVKLAQFEHRAAFCTWITRIAIHEALARVERLGKFKSEDVEEDGTLAALQSREMSPEESMVKTEMRELLEQAILSLPFPYRTVVMLRDVEEMSTAEAANALELTEEAVKVRLHRGRAMLRKELYIRAGATSASAFQFHAMRCDRVTAQVCTRIAEIVRE